MLAKDLDLLGKTYLREYKLISNAPAIQSCELARIISNHFSNLPLAGQVKMMYAILNKKETHLYTLIKSTYERINIVFQ